VGEPAVDVGGGARVESEHGPEERGEDGVVGLAGVGDATHLRQRLQQAGKRENAIVDGLDGRHRCGEVGRGAGHAASRVAVSRGASVASMTAPPRHSSPAYSTSD